MDRVVIALVLMAVAVAVALVLQRAGPDAPARAAWTVPDQLDADISRRIGGAFARFTGAPRLLMARDMRPSGDELSTAFADGAFAPQSRMGRALPQNDGGGVHARRAGILTGYSFVAGSCSVSA